MRRVDVVSLIVGLLLTALAGLALWWSFDNAVDWDLVKIATPLILVLVGIVGLSLSRNRE
ncbi:MAG: hypothetical protein ACTH2Q_12545 [Propionibacteriaceae bacterium]